MIESVDIEPTEPRGELVALSDYRREVATPSEERVAADALVEERARWNDLGRRIAAPNLAEARAIVEAWLQATRRAIRR